MLDADRAAIPPDTDQGDDDGHGDEGQVHLCLVDPYGREVSVAHSLPPGCSAHEMADAIVALARGLAVTIGGELPVALAARLR